MLGTAASLAYTLVFRKIFVSRSKLGFFNCVHDLFTTIVTSGLSGIDCESKKEEMSPPCFPVVFNRSADACNQLRGEEDTIDTCRIW